jgi:hypothetical protein
MSNNVLIFFKGDPKFQGFALEMINTIQKYSPLHSPLKNIKTLLLILKKYITKLLF